ncbi:hypothetical protein Tco_0720302 [Tanacetum coccineum]
MARSGTDLKMAKLLSFKLYVSRFWDLLCDDDVELTAEKDWAFRRAARWCGKDIKVKKSKNRQEMKRQVQERDLKPISKAESRPWSRKVKKVKKRTK